MVIPILMRRKFDEDNFPRGKMLDLNEKKKNPQGGYSIILMLYMQLFDL